MARCGEDRIPATGQVSSFWTAKPSDADDLDAFASGLGLLCLRPLNVSSAPLLSQLCRPPLCPLVLVLRCMFGPDRSLTALDPKPSQMARPRSAMPRLLQASRLTLACDQNLRDGEREAMNPNGPTRYQLTKESSEP